MSNGSVADETCGVFSNNTFRLNRGRIHRFLVGEDDRPRAMPPDEAKRELGDSFATLLLLKGVFPKSAEDVLAQIDKHAKANSPLRRHMTFVVGETSQIPRAQGSERLRRNVRFIVTRGSDGAQPPEGPDILISIGNPGGSDIELMAWDRTRGGFNYYRAVGDGPAWVFAGNSRHAVSGPTQGKGPFESHRSGAFLMKELKLPWVNWDSPEAPMTAEALPRDDPRARHPWFTKKEPGGAYTFELAVARPAIERWARARFDAIAAAGTIEDPRRIMEQVLGVADERARVANLASSNVESRRVVASKVPVDLPPSFFADVDGLAEAGLVVDDLLTVEADLYAKTLGKFKVRLEDGSGFVRPGDTHFAFAVPERAFEDVVVIREALRVTLLTRRLAACLLMVDFPNPVFSERRAKLLDHVPRSATIRNGRSRFSQQMADAILKAAPGTPDGSPEREFAERWNVGKEFDPRFNRLLTKYFGALKKRLKTQAGFDDCWRIAHARRELARKTPVFGEFDLVFPKSDVPRPVRRMRADGTVA